ncbi:MAG: hypothetical protein ACC653_10950 [Gammaproteobacteria bacterium]
MSLESEIISELHDDTRNVKKLQLMVYPALIAFLLLAAYGYYLVNSLATDVKRLSNDMNTLTKSVDRNMNIIAQNMIMMTQTINVMARASVNMQRDMWSLNRNISTPLSPINSMLPWGGGGRGGPYPGSQGPIPYSPPPGMMQPNRYPPPPQVKNTGIPES